MAKMTTSVFYIHPQHLLHRTKLLTCRNIGVSYSAKPEAKTFGEIHKFCAYWFNLNIKKLDPKFNSVSLSHFWPAF